MNDRLVIVIYIGVSNIRYADISEYVEKILERITPNISGGEFIAIPVDEPNSRIECINPKYITNDELINKNHALMYELNNELTKQLKIIKNEE